MLCGQSGEEDSQNRPFSATYASVFLAAYCVTLTSTNPLLDNSQKVCGTDTEAGWRATFVETPLPDEQKPPVQHLSLSEYIHIRAQAVHARLSKIVTVFRGV